MRSNITAADLNENSRNCDANLSKLLHVSWIVQRCENFHHDCVESNLLFLQEDKNYYDYNWIKIQQFVAQITESLLKQKCEISLFLKYKKHDFSWFKISILLHTHTHILTQEDCSMPEDVNFFMLFII